MSVQNVLDLIEEMTSNLSTCVLLIPRANNNIEGIPAHVLVADGEEWFEEGQAFDGSSIGGWKGIQASDMTLRADLLQLHSSIHSTTNQLWC